MFDFGVFFKILIQVFFSLLKGVSFILIPIGIALIIVIINSFREYLRLRFIEKIKPKKGLPRQKKTSLFKHICILWPKQLAYDFLTQDPNAFDKFGIHIFVGPQGSGKTMTAIYLLQEWQKQYPKMQVYTNLAYKFETGELEHWQELIDRENGIYGIVNVIDEMKTWWSNKDSKDVPAEMLGEISQQRKQKKAIFGTVQVFSELAKPLRSQTHYIYVPYTFMNSLTIVFKAKAKDYDVENDRFKKFRGFFIFAHTRELRDSYDTYKRIQKYKEQEFASSSVFQSTDVLPTT